MTTDNAPAKSPTEPELESSARTKGIVSLILGILSLLAFLVPIFGLSGIAAIILGFLSRRSESNTKAFAFTGIFLGIVGAIGGAVFLTLNVIIVVEALRLQGG